MNDGVKLLLERIKTHPEEFLSSNGGLFDSRNRWQLLVQSYESYLVPEDRDALRTAMNEVMAEKFTEAVMKELMGVEDDDPLGKSRSAQQTGMPLGGATQGAYQQARMQTQAQHTLLQAQLAQQQALQNSVSASGSHGSYVPLASGAFDDRSSWKKFKDWLSV